MAGKILIFSYSESGTFDSAVLRTVKDAGDKYAEYAIWTPADQGYQLAEALAEKIKTEYGKATTVKPFPERCLEDFDESYKAAVYWLKTVWMKKYDKPDIVIDYTGGRRDAAYGLISASIALGLGGFVRTVSERVNNKFEIRKTDDRTDIGRIVNDQNFIRAGSFFSKFNYKAAQELLETVNIDRLVVVTPAFGRLFGILNAFYLQWDLFDHVGARKAIEALDGDQELKKLCEFVNPAINEHRRVVGFLAGNSDMEAIARKGRAWPKENLADLVNNAERRFAQGKYDDAVARLYRTVEALAGMALQENGLNPSDIVPERAPAGEAREYCLALEATRGKRQLGLYKAFELLSKLPGEKCRALGGKFLGNGALQQKLEARNHSILAHGYRPVEPVVYKEIREHLLELVRSYYPKIDQQMEEIKFPQTIEEPINDSDQIQD
jgi:CRISPR-associated protein (TIGR02710 family)